jgi:flagellar motility protein MotE (MotC chaperone)
MNLAFRKPYKGIDLLEIKPLEAHAVNIEKLQDTMRSVSVRKVLAIGKELIEARERLGKKGSGKFGAWCRDRLKMSRRSCYNYIYAYEVFGDCATVAQMFDVTAMYHLAQPGVPSKAVTEALIHAEGGRRITMGWARLILDLLESERKEEEPKYERPKAPKKKEKRDSEADDEPDGEDSDGKQHDKESRQLARLKKVYNQANVDDRRQFEKWLEERAEKYRYKRHAKIKRLVECGDKGVEVIKRKGEFKPKYDRDGRRVDREKLRKKARADARMRPR